MAIDEKYLDDLLKSITENEEEPRTMDDAMREMASSSEEDDDEAEDGDDFFTGEQDLDFDNTAVLEDYLEKALSEAESVPEEEEVDLEEMELLKEITAAGLSYEQVSLEPSSDEDELDIAEMINQADAADDALEEINGLLNKVDEGAAVDEDILALLENMENNGEGEEIEDPFKLLESEAAESMQVQESKAEEKPAPKEKKAKKKKNKKEKPEKPEKTEKADKKFRVLGKKKRGDEKSQSEDMQSDEEIMEIANEELMVEPKEIEVEEIESGIGSYEEAEPSEDLKTKDMDEKENIKEKKKGFFSKLMAAFAEDEDDFEDASEENKKLLKEIGDEEKKAKKVKKKKEKTTAKKPKKEKPKKPKAPKKPKEKKEEKVKVKEKPVKPLGKKTWFIAIAFGGTVLASIMLLNAFLPEYADKKAAQKAFYIGDYEAVYTLLYDKRLSEDESLLFNKAKTICTIERRIKSYENNVTLNREPEAVDALLKGVACYQLLVEADEYGVRSEVDALYSQICSILVNDYGITEEKALEINTYDSKDYTQKLHEILYGSNPANVDATDEPEAAAKPLPPQDVLPEEETMIN